MEKFTLKYNNGATIEVTVGQPIVIQNIFNLTTDSGSVEILPAPPKGYVWNTTGNNFTFTLEKFKIKLSKLHKEGIENWGKFYGEKEVLQLFPDGSLGRISFTSLGDQEYESTEFRCAMKFLDDLDVPRKTKEGETYSIVGRIIWLRNNLKVI